MLAGQFEFHDSFEKLAEATSPSAALRLCAFFGHASIYVPLHIPENHVLRFVIGDAAADALAFEFGAQTLDVPSAELTDVRRAGLIFSLARKGLSVHHIARVLGISMSRVKQVIRSMQPLLDVSEDGLLSGVKS